jgi:hypothetical protein
MDDRLPAACPLQVPSGHLGMWECPQEFVTAVTEFVHQASGHRAAAHASSKRQTHFK